MSLTKFKILMKMGQRKQCFLPLFYKTAIGYLSREKVLQMFTEIFLMIML